MAGVNPDIRDWVDEILFEWADQVRMRPLHDVVVTPGGFATNIHEGGPLSGKETALGTPTRPQGHSREPVGYLVKGLAGRARHAAKAMQALRTIDHRAHMVLRAEVGLVDQFDCDAVTEVKAKHLGVHVDGKPWNAQRYKELKSLGKCAFAVAYRAVLMT